MVKNIFSIGYHHNMFIIEIIVNTDIAASYGLCQKWPLNNGLSIAIKRYVDILVMIYFFPIFIVYKDIYQHVVFPTIIIRKSKFPKNPKRSVQKSPIREKRSVQK